MKKPNHHKLEQSGSTKFQALYDIDLINDIVDSMPGLFYVINQKGWLVRWNKNFETVTGLPPEVLANYALKELIVPEDRERVMSKVEKLFSDGHPDEDEYLFLTKDGPRPFLGSGYRVRIGEKDYMVGMTLDISKLEQTEKELRKVRDEFEQKVV